MPRNDFINVDGTINYDNIASTPALDTHKDDRAPHGATASATANTLALRDANGNVVSALPVTNGQNPNLLFNPTFELGLIGWSKNALDTNVTITPKLDVVNGSYLSLTNSTATTIDTYYDSQHIPVGAGVVISLQVEMSTSGQTAGGGPAIQVRAFDSVGTDLGSVATLTKAIGQPWGKLVALGTTPTNTANIAVRFLYWNSSVSTFTGFRKIKVESGSIATTFSDDNTLNTVQYGSALPLAQILSGGNKKQTGTGAVTIATAGTRVNLVVTFPVAFSTTPTVTIGVTAAGTDDAGYINVRAAVASSTSVTFSVNCYLAQTINFNWEATGT